MFVVVLENRSTRADLTAEWRTRVAAALTVQLQRDFCPDYGLAAWSVTADASSAPADAPRVTLFDHTDQPGAAGYHATTPEGAPYASVFCESDARRDIEVTTSHELLELVADLWADRVRMHDDGTGDAEEVCDAVEDVTYMIEAVTVSDYVLPSWFEMTGRYPFDRQRALTAPRTRTAGGYRIVYAHGTVDTDPPEAKRRRKKHAPSSRTARRIARASVRVTASP